MCCLGAIIGLELIVRTGNAQHLHCRSPVRHSDFPHPHRLTSKNNRSIHRQNLIQTAISGATFFGCQLPDSPIGIPVVMGRPDLMFSHADRCFSGDMHRRHHSL
jgi:hypothetical protein